MPNSLSPARDALVAWLIAHPNSTKAEIGAGLGWNTKKVENTIMAAEKSPHASRLFVQAAGRWATTATASTATATCPNPPADFEVVDWKARAEELEAERARWLRDEAELREWRCRIEGALGFDTDGEHVEIEIAVERIASLEAEAQGAGTRAGAELVAIDEALGFRAGSTRTPGDRVARIRQHAADVFSPKDLDEAFGRGRDDAQAELAAIDNALAAWGVPAPGSRVDRIVDIRRRHVADAGGKGCEHTAPNRGERCALCGQFERSEPEPGEPMRVMQVGESQEFGPCVTLTCDRTAAKQLGERLYEHVRVTL